MQNIFKKEFFKKDITIALICAFIFTACLSFLGFDLRCQDLRENILRLHILANSDSPQDQWIKLKVRDRIISESEEIYKNADSKDEAIYLTNQNLERLTNAARDELKKEGYTYGAKISVGDAYFETREYDDFTLPAGNYKAVRVLLGKAEGKNWWCVMFPSLCLPASGEKQSLEKAVDSSSAEVAENSEKYKVGFKLVEVYEDIKNFFKGWL